MIGLKGLVDGEGCAGKNFSKEKEGAGLRVDQHVVLADPAQASPLGQGALQHRRAVHERPVVVSADGVINPGCQLRETLADQFVVIAPQCVTGNIGALPVSKRFFRAVRRRQIVHSHRNHPSGTRHQGGGRIALVTMMGHIVHFALITRCQPVLQMGCVLTGIRGGDTHIREPELSRPLTDKRWQISEFRICSGAQ